MNSSMCQLGVQDERIFASFSRHLVGLATAAGGWGTGVLVTNALNMMCLPGIVLDRHGFVVEVNARAHAVFDANIYIKDNYFCIRDREACARLKASLKEMTMPVQLKSLIAEPILVQRRYKLPVVLRTLPFKEPTQSSEQEVHAIVTLTACGTDPGHPQRSSPRIFVV
jgi:hypothetical protein